MIIGLLGIVILTLDQILWETAPPHAYGLILFVVIDFVLGSFVIARSSGMAFTLAAGWSAVRIIIQIGDVFLGPSVGISYAGFADYLFNPMAVNPPNPAGVPGGLIDLIIILQIVVIWAAWKGRSLTQKTSMSSP
jgi:hypothetical protein